MTTAPYSTTRWWSQDTVAVVTGTSYGIGFEIARILGDQGLHVVLVSRSNRNSAGQSTAEELKQVVPEGSFTAFPADITNAAAVSDCVKFVKDTFGGISILVNNAGMAYKGNTFGADEAQKTIDTNLKGTRRMTEAFLPLMTSDGRIVNVCSRSGKLNQLKSKDLMAAFTAPADADAIEATADSFVQAIRDGNHSDKGWSNSMYGVSKLAEISYTLWLARQVKDKGIMVNAVCPGWCQTYMSSFSGPNTAADGADTPVWIALRPPDEFLTEKFLTKRAEVEW